MSPRVHRSRVSHERWLVSYADFITLLFSFFVVLYAFANADKEKQHQVSAAIDSGFQSLSIGRTAVSTATSPETKSLRTETDRYSNAEIQADLEETRRDLQKRLSSQISRKIVAIETSRSALVISLREAGFFDSGTATPRPETTETLHQISETIRGTRYEIRVEGHTDNVPIHNSRFDSNWELSSARATCIARILLHMDAIPPEQLSAAGYAEYHPVADNRSAEGRAENRRVDLVVMPHTAFQSLDAVSAENSAGWRRITDP